MPRRRGNSIEARWYAGGVRQSKSSTKWTWTECLAFERDQQVKAARGEFVDLRAGKVLFSDWWSEYLDGLRLRAAPGTVAQRETLGRRLVAEFGRYPIGSISGRQVEALASTLVAEGSRSVNDTIKTLRACMRVAIDRQMITVDPTRGISVRQDKPEMRVLDVAEVEALAAATRPEYRASIWVMALGGLRVGEMAGLRRDRIRGRQLVVERQVTENRSVLSETTTLKTKASKRALVMSRRLQAEVEHHITKYGIGASELLFTGPSGGLLSRTWYRRRVLLPAAATAEITGVTTHSLRHTAVALLIEAGENSPKVIAERMGHGSIQMAMDTYGHLLPGRDEQAADRLDDLFGVTAGADLRVVGGNDE